MKRISRRAFLAVGAGAGALIAGGLVLRGRGRGGCAAAEGVDAVRCRLAAFLSDADGVSALGEVSRRSNGDDVAALAVAIAPASATDPERWFATVGNDGFGVHLRARARADFAAGEVLIVDGWRLSRTESQVCALWSLVR